jgi:hypothetical protein
MAVDSTGNVAYDPSANVLDLVAAAIARQDDLRRETDRRYDREMWWERYVAEVRAAHAKEIRESDNSRIAQTRQVDVQAGATAQAEQFRAIQALATTQAAEREALRALVASTADTLAKTHAATVSEINARLRILEETSYKGAGKEAMSNPLTAALFEEVKSLRESRAMAGGKSEGMSATAKIVVAGIGLVATLVGLIGSALLVVSFLR